LGAGSFVGTFGLFDVLSREKTSSTNGAFAPTFATQGLIFGEPTKKTKKEADIKKVLNLGRYCTQDPHGVLQVLFYG
jgi:hypothetical protein